MQCNKCGQELHLEDVFCGKCGNKNENMPQYMGATDTYFENDVPSDIELNMSMASDESSSLVPTETIISGNSSENFNERFNENPNENVNESFNENFNESFNENPQFSNGPNDAPKGKLTKTSTILVIVVSCLTLIVIGFVTLYVFSGNHDEKEINNQIQGFLNETSQLDLEGMSQYVTPEVAERLIFIDNLRAALGEVLGVEIDDTSKGPVEITAESIEVKKVNGDSAYVETEIEFKVLGISAGYDTTFQMSKIDGEWLIDDIKLRILNFSQE